jgi:hypothetical protein
MDHVDTEYGIRRADRPKRCSLQTENEEIQRRKANEENFIITR